MNIRYIVKVVVKGEYSVEVEAKSSEAAKRKALDTLFMSLANGYMESVGELECTAEILPSEIESLAKEMSNYHE